MDLHVFHVAHIVVRMEQPRLSEGHFGQHVSSLLADRGISLREAAAQTDIPLSTLHRRLRSQSMTFTLGELTRVAALLDTTAGTLVSAFEDAAA